MKTIPFSPLKFLAPLGAGGIAVMPFASMNYMRPHESGLIGIADVGHGVVPFYEDLFLRWWEGVMIVFIVLHLILTVLYTVQLVRWLMTGGQKELIKNPLENAVLVTPFISYAMTMNMIIGPVRYFFPWIAMNLQALMVPAFSVWIVLWATLLFLEISLLRISFTNNFDVTKIHFGWLLHPFALGMMTVTGTGIAAMAHNSTIAHSAAFLSLISGTMGVFLLAVKMIALFKSHFAASGLPERQFYPSFLMVIPNVTLYAISAYRFAHYVEQQHDIGMGAFGLLVLSSAFAFETWYLLFGLALLEGYLRKYFGKEFTISQWGFICPIVAYAVLGSFTYKFFWSTPLLQWVIAVAMLFVVILFFVLLYKDIRYARSFPHFSS